MRFMVPFYFLEPACASFYIIFSAIKSEGSLFTPASYSQVNETFYDVSYNCDRGMMGSK
jgi:hypothetical protein